MSAVAPLSRWSTRPLDDFFEIVGGGTPSKKEPTYWGGDIPWASIRDMHSAELSSTEFAITESGLQNSSTKIIPAGEVIMASRVGLGKACVLMQDTAINQDIRALIPRRPDKTEQRFCLYWLQSIADVIADAGSGATVKGVKLPFIKSLPFPDIEPEEQKRIVAVLDQAFSALDRARELIEFNLADTQLLKNSVRETELDSRDKDWTETTIGDICDRFEYGTSSKSSAEGMIPVLRMGNLQGGEIDWNDLKYSNDASDIEKYSLNAGDVLFNRTNSIEHVGKTAIYRGEREAIFAGYLIRLHYKRDQVHSDYLNIFLNSDRAKAHGHSLMGKSVNQANISASKLRTYPIALPSLTEQRAIADKIHSIEKLNQTLHDKANARLINIDNLRQSILAKAFAGELI